MFVSHDVNQRRPYRNHS